ncbi:MAG: AraC family ligand binding domain-containing protein, partial [Flavobacteriaceae bacterium]
LPLEGHVQRNYQTLDSFVVLIVVEGVCELIYQNKTFSLKRGEVLLIPASLDPISLQANKARLLEVYMP